MPMIKFRPGQIWFWVLYGGLLCLALPGGREAGTVWAGTASTGETKMAQTATAPEETATLTSTGPVTLRLATEKATEKLSLRPGETQVVETTEKITEVAVGNPEIVDVRLLSPRQILLNARNEGWTTLVLGSTATGYRRYEVVVLAPSVPPSLPDPVLVEATLARPGVRARWVEQTLVLEGEVSSQAEAERVERLARIYTPRVLNLLTVKALPPPAPSPPQIRIKIKVVELARESLRELGINWRGRFTWQGDGSGAASFGFSVPQAQLEASIAALQRQGKATILAEPELLAISGSEAQFLAGGEVPVPLLQESGTSILWKEYGVRLAVTPRLESGEELTLRLRPEVSSLDWANGVQLAGAKLPAVRCRWVETEIRSRSGQTITLAGLLQEAEEEEVRGIPFLRDLPLLGKLFGVELTRKERRELVIFVTPVILPAGREQREEARSWPSNGE